MDFGWHLPCYGSLAIRGNLILVAREAEARGLSLMRRFSEDIRLLTEAAP